MSHYPITAATYYALAHIPLQFDIPSPPPDWLTLQENPNFCAAPTSVEREFLNHPQPRGPPVGFLQFWFFFMES